MWTTLYAAFQHLCTGSRWQRVLYMRAMIGMLRMTERGSGGAHPQEAGLWLWHAVIISRGDGIYGMPALCQALLHRLVLST